MIKTIFPFAGPNTQIARLVDVHSRGIDKDWLTKRAAVLTKELSAIRPEKGHSFIHAISMGCMEAYGANRNGDGFNEKTAKYELPEPEKGRSKKLTLDGGLTQNHKTFTKYAKVYKDHVNKDPELASGDIVAENSSVWRLFGSPLTIRLTSLMKPISSILSASSNTSTSTPLSCIVFRWIWSNSRPGVATTISMPRRSAVIWLLMLTPP